MKLKALSILLVVSVVFNTFFIIGYARSRSAPPARQSFEHRARGVAKRLNLDQQQLEKFETLLARTIEERTTLRQQNRPLRQQLLAELIKDQPDDHVLRQLATDDVPLARREMMIQHTKQFMDILRPEQRRVFVELIQSRWNKQDR